MTEIEKKRHGGPHRKEREEKRERQRKQEKDGYPGQRAGRGSLGPWGGGGGRRSALGPQTQLPVPKLLHACCRHRPQACCHILSSIPAHAGGLIIQKGEGSPAE